MSDKNIAPETIGTASCYHCHFTLGTRFVRTAHTYQQQKNKSILSNSSGWFTKIRFTWKCFMAFGERLQFCTIYYLSVSFAELMSRVHWFIGRVSAWIINWWERFFSELWQWHAKKCLAAINLLLNMQLTFQVWSCEQQCCVQPLSTSGFSLQFFPCAVSCSVYQKFENYFHAFTASG